MTSLNRPSHLAASMSQTALSPAGEDCQRHQELLERQIDLEDTDEEEEEEEQQPIGLLPFPVRAGKVMAVCGDLRTSQEGLWLLAKLLQPLTLGTMHVQVRWLKHDFATQKKLHNTSQVYQRTNNGQTIHTATIFALGVAVHECLFNGKTSLVEVNVQTANKLDRDWYKFDCQVEHQVDIATPAGSRTKRRRSETGVGSEVKR
jgi:hypothetical protein